MRGDTHPVDELMRAAVDDPSPTTTDVLSGRRMLLSAMKAEERRGAVRTNPGRRRPRRAFAAGALVLVAAIAVGSVVLDSPPVTALGDLAQVAERAEVPAAPEGEYLYTRISQTSLIIVPGADLGLPATDAVAYLLPTVRERWQGGDGAYEEETARPPRFFDPAHEAAYYASDLPAVDGIGETATGDFTDTGQFLEERNWPTDAEEMLEAMRITAREDATSEQGAVIELAAELLRETGAEPELRAAVIGALDMLGVGVVERTQDGKVTFAVDYDTDGIRSRMQLEFDADANLVRQSRAWIDGDPELGIPAMTRVEDTRQLGVRPVPSVGTR